MDQLWQETLGCTHSGVGSGIWNDDGCIDEWMMKDCADNEGDG